MFEGMSTSLLGSIGELESVILCGSEVLCKCVSKPVNIGFSDKFM